MTSSRLRAIGWIFSGFAYGALDIYLLCISGPDAAPFIAIATMIAAYLSFGMARIVGESGGGKRRDDD
jgi:hypothetical protein